MQRLIYFKFLAVFIGLFSLGISAQTPPSVTLQPFLSSGLSSPLYLTSAKDGSNRLFIVQKGGIIKVVQPVSNTVTDFLNISTVIATSGERGLLGLAFHPMFASNRRFFVYYTRLSDGAIEIAEYQASATNPNVADPNGRVIITIPHSANDNHNGGMIEFGPDGYLYAGTGDGGSANDPPGNAQNPAQLLGKMLRLDVNIPNGSTVPYLIPPTNPFVGANTVRCDAGSTTVGNTCQEIWAIGMRNPFRWSFDRGGSRQLWVGDVGQSLNEEVDVITTGGGNFGWRIMEGTQCTPGVNPNCTPPAGHIPPIFQYGHTGGRCSITGGYVYRGTRGTLPVGSYVYGDYCTGEIILWNNSQQTVLLDTTRNIPSFGEDEAGEIYVVGLGGTVEKLTLLNPTAAAVTVTGRALTAKGRGISGAVIKLTDVDGNVRTVITSAFGYYRFTDVAAGATYIISAASKRYIFNQPAQSFSFNGDTEDINFTANY